MLLVILKVLRAGFTAGILDEVDWIVPPIALRTPLSETLDFRNAIQRCEYPFNSVVKRQDGFFLPSLLFRSKKLHPYGILFEDTSIATIGSFSVLESGALFGLCFKSADSLDSSPKAEMGQRNRRIRL